MEETKAKRLSAALDRLMAAYSLIVGAVDMPIDGRAGYLVAVVRVDDDVTGLDHLQNGDLFQLIRSRLTEKDGAREPTRG
jgi:hypothetical protein